MEVGDELGGYRLERLLGSGGMGAVFEARRPGQPRVAIKVLLPGADPELLARFDREAKVLRRLDAPGIARILDYGLDQGRAYLVQELCPEGDLAALLKKRGRLAPEEARALILHLAEAVGAAHSVGVIHRDLKPANVLLAGGRPKLTDFGLARAKGIDRASLTETGVFLGTPAYMAPEQLLDAREVDERSEVYALGVLLFELLSGARPFQGGTALAVADAVLNGRAANLPAAVPPDLREVVQRAMAREPGERYASAAELAAALQRDPPPAVEPAPPAALSPVALASLVLVGLLLLLTLGLYARDEEPGSSLAKGTGPPGTEAPQGTAPPSAAPTPTPSAAAPPASPAAPLPGLTLEEALEACRDPRTLAGGIARIEVLARANDPDACLAYGRLLLAGFGVKRSRERAGHYLSQAKEQGRWEAGLLLACCSPPNEWRKRQQESLKDFTAEVKAGDPNALRFVALNRNRLLDHLYPEVVARAPDFPALAELHAYFEVQQGTTPRDVVLARLRESKTLEARLTRGRIALMAPRPLEVEPDLVRLLEGAARQGSPFAAAILGEAFALGRLGQGRDQGKGWLEYAALRGRGDAAFARWRMDQPDLRWLKLAAALGHSAALAPLGAALLKAEDPEAETWLDAAFLLSRDPRAAGLLAKVRRSKAPQEALRLARVAASQPDPPSLQIYAEILMDPATGRTDPWRALEIQAARACLGDASAALEAARIADQVELPTSVQRALLRRGLYALKPDLRARAKDRLRELTASIPATAPVASQSQLVLLERAAKGDREATIEVGLRASREAPGGRFEEAMIAAAETGDLPSRLRLVRFQASKRALDAELLAEFEAIAEAGLYEAWIYSSAPSPALIEKLERRLRDPTARGEPEALYAMGVVLYQRPETRAEARALLERARDAGLEKAAEYLLPSELSSLSDPQLLARLDELWTRQALRTKVGLTLMSRSDGRLQQRGRRALVVACLQGAPAQVAFDLGRHLVKTGTRMLPSGETARHPDWSVGALWIRVAVQKRHRTSQLMLGQMYLDIRDPAYRRRGFRLLDEIATKLRHPRAKLIVGTACLKGDGTPVDLARAERELSAVAATFPMARARLGEVYAAQGRQDRALDLLERELAAKNLHARVPLVELHLRGSARGASPARGLELLQAGARAGEPPACILLGDLYQEGHHVRATPTRPGSSTDAQAKASTEDDSRGTRSSCVVW